MPEGGDDSNGLLNESEIVDSLIGTSHKETMWQWPLGQGAGF
jgi:hypothetical protein